jgi:hypothetical protein
MNKLLDELVVEFDGAIKYTPMLKDHPEWTKEQCLAFAHKWHAVAVERLRKSAVGWNDGVPYCRNNPTPKLLAEAK